MPIDREKMGDDETPKPQKLSIMDLDTAHREVFSAAILKILATELAEITYAQIVDGLPLDHIARETSRPWFTRDHPFWDSHHELCPGVLDKVREFRACFCPAILSFDPKVLTHFPDLWYAQTTIMTYHCIAYSGVPSSSPGIKGIQNPTH